MFDSDFKNRLDKGQRKLDEAEASEKKADLDEIRLILESGEQIAIPKPEERIYGAFSN